MMTKRTRGLVVWLAIVLAMRAVAADPQVANVRAAQRPGTRTVEITYDVTDPDGNGLNVVAAISTNSGATYDLKAVSFSGDGYGGVTAGSGRTIVWDAGLDWSGNFSTQLRVRVTAETLPPAPESAASEPEAGVATLMGGSMAFLYSGTNPVQTGVATGTIDNARVAVLRGRTLKEDGTPLAGVTVKVEGHSEYGQTVTRTNGCYDLAVNGGGPLSVTFTNAAYLSVQRTVHVPWLEFVNLDDVIMKAADTNLTRLTLAKAGARQDSMLVARGGAVTDSDGTRRALVMLPPDIGASIINDSGQTQAIETLTTRFTEFTVGTNGPAAMPGDLPPTVAYTYAVELGAAEARRKAAGKDVLFNTNVYFYVENFLGMPAGIAVPMAYYDATARAWVPSADGRVIQLMGTNSEGIAYVDADGDGQADDPAALAALGFTDRELRSLGREYAATQSLWRAPITHFSQWDCNYGVVGPPDSQGPNTGGPGTESDINPPSEQPGQGTVELENQVFRETIPVLGTPFSLNYSTLYCGARAANATVDIPLTGPDYPASLKRVELTIDIAGRRFAYSYDPEPSLSQEFVWDGLDAYGRRLLGGQRASINLSYVYDGYYALPPGIAASFGYPAGTRVPSDIPARQEVKMARNYTMVLSRNAPPSAAGLGGWSLNVHHSYDPVRRVLYLGDGTRQDGQLIRAEMDMVGTRVLSGRITAFAGTGAAGYSGDGGPATNASLRAPRGMAVAPDGSLYIADSSNNCVRRVDGNGVITTVAGTGVAGFGGDGGPATNAALHSPMGVAVAGDGTLFIADSGNCRVRRVAPGGGIITTVAGNGLPGYPAGVNDEGALATSAYIGAVRDVAVAADGTLYLACGDICRIRRVGPDGRIATVAGNGTAGYSGDGGPGSNAVVGVVQGIELARDGSLYFCNGLVHPAVRRLSPQGIVTTVAGTGVAGYSGDGGPATSAKFNGPADVAICPDGTLLIADDQNRCIRAVTPDGIVKRVAGRGSAMANQDGGPALYATFNRCNAIATGPDEAYYIVDGDLRVRKVAPVMVNVTYVVRSEDMSLIPSADGGSVYKFDSKGRHLATYNSVGGGLVFSFGYDPNDYLATITDADGNVTVIQRDVLGRPTAIVSPDGMTTTLALDDDGYLASVTNPKGETTALGYSGGLLTTVTDARGGAYQTAYDTAGRVRQVSDPAGGCTLYGRQALSNGVEVASTSALGRVRGVKVESLADGSRRRTWTRADGKQELVVNAADGTETATAPDGTVTTTVYGDDPRFGMQAPYLKSRVVRLPSGLTSTTLVSRAVTLAGGSALNVLCMSNATTVNDKTRTWVYTATNNTVTAVTPAGRATTSTVDARMRLLSEQLTGLYALSNAYDGRGRLSRSVRGAGAEARTTVYSYNSQGLVAAATNALGLANRLQYDAAGRLASETWPDGSQVGFSYDANGNRIAVTPPGRSAHVFTYNNLDLLSSYTPPAVGGVTNRIFYAYNAERQLTVVTRPDGSIISNTYDSGGRLSAVKTPDGQYSYGYAADGHLMSVAAPGGITLTYSHDGALVTQTRWSGVVTGRVAYAFNRDFLVTGLTVNGAASVGFGHDPDGLITNAGLCAIGYNADNGLLCQARVGGATSVWSHNGFGEVTNIIACYAGTNIFQCAMGRDKLGRLTNCVEIVLGATNRYDYVYDAAGRLVEVRTNDLPASAYQYDVNGNITNFTAQGVAGACDYDGQDRLVSYTGGTNRYDANGMLTNKTVGGLAYTFRYDAMGNLAGATLPGGTNIQYLLDGANRRVARLVDGAFRQGFLYAGALNPVAELNAASNVVTIFVYGSHLTVPDYMVKTGATYRFVCDTRGSPRLVVNADTGDIAQQLEYDEFGRVVLDTNPGFQPFGFCGGLYDPDTGLVRFGRREYDAATRRWTRPDPLLFAGGQPNLYAYVNNDPVNRTDATGLGPADPSWLWNWSGPAGPVIDWAGVGATLFASADWAGGPILGGLGFVSSGCSAISTFDNPNSQWYDKVKAIALVVNAGIGMLGGPEGAILSTAVTVADYGSQSMFTSAWETYYGWSTRPQAVFSDQVLNRWQNSSPDHRYEGIYSQPMNY